jgi:hypothetical protein
MFPEGITFLAVFIGFIDDFRLVGFADAGRPGQIGTAHGGVTIDPDKFERLTGRHAGAVAGDPGEFLRAVGCRRIELGGLAVNDGENLADEKIDAVRSAFSDKCVPGKIARAIRVFRDDKGESVLLFVKGHACCGHGKKPLDLP